MKTQRLIIMPYRECDCNDMIAILTDETVKKTFMIPDFKSRDEAEALFRKLYAFSLAPDRYERGIYLDGKLIGFVNDVCIGDNGKSIEIGYVISTPYSGKGYATEAVSAVISELFSLGYERVDAGAFIENKASFRVMEKCGMKPSGNDEVVFYHGESRKCKGYSIFKND